MTFQNKLQRNLVAALTDLLDSLKIEYFFGGSRRFGYFIANSDVDIFLSVSCEKDQERIIEFIRRSGLILDESAEHDPEYGDEVYKILGFIHLVFVKDEHLFLANKMNHSSVKRMIDKNPILLDIASSLRNSGISGSGIYRLLFEVCN